MLTLPSRRVTYNRPANQRHPFNVGLVHWSLAGIPRLDGASVCPDLTGKYPLTLTNTTWVTGFPSAGALVPQFNGSTSSGQIPGLTAHSAIRAYAFWVWRTGKGGNNLGRIFDKLDSGTTSIESFGWDDAANASAGGLRFTRAWSTTTGLWDWTAPATNEWHHFVLSYNTANPANVPSLQMDGALLTATTATAASGSITNNTSSYWIGNRGAGDQAWDGRIADIRFVNRTAVSMSAHEKTVVFQERSRVFTPLFNYQQQPVFFATQVLIPRLLARKRHLMMQRQP